MPTYEYVCTSCRNHFDTVQSFSDPPLQRCELCGGEVRRVFHPAGILFKGSGFYSTDNRRVGSSGGKPKPGEKAAKTEKSEKTAESSTKTAEKSA